MLESPRSFAVLVLAGFVACGVARAGVPNVGGCQVLPADNYWNTPVDTLPLHPSSATWVASVGGAAHLHADWDNVLADNYGIPYTTVTGAQPLVQIRNYSDPPFNDPSIDYSDESDPGPYPIPPNAPIEGGAPGTGDTHVLVVETTHCVLYELYFANGPQPDNTWFASSYAKWPLGSNALRPAGWTSADAAGLPIFPGLVRYDEVAAGEIDHAIRFTANHIWGATASGQMYLWPARHASGSVNNPNYPPMGARFRLKASFDISSFSAPTQVILRAMKKYGLVLADGGSNWYFQGVSDTRWPDAVFSEIGSIAGSNFEVVDTSAMMIDPNSGQSVQPGADVALTESAAPNPAVTGKDVVFTIQATNNGPGAAIGTTVYASYDAAASVIWVSPGCVKQGASALYACDAGTLANGATATFKVVLRKDTAGSTYDNAGVTSATVDTNAANNSPTLAVTVNASPPANAVLRYRLYSPVTLEHLYTTDLNEYNTLGALTGTWQQEGTVGHVLDNPGSFNSVTAVPYYRLYDTSSQRHHWTTDPNEYYTLIQFPNWNAEGVDGFILPTNTTGATQLYRLMYPFVPGLHHWTIDPNEYNTLITTYGWIGEGGSGFVIQ